MDREEFCTRHNISSEILAELEATGLALDEEFTSQEIELVNKFLTYKIAGITPEDISELLRLEEQGEHSAIQREKIIARQRKRQMNELHGCQKKIDRLDYLILKLKNDRRQGT